MVLLVATGVIAIGERLRHWLKDTKSGLQLDDDDPAGFHPRDEIIWRLAQAVILPLGYLKWWTGTLEVRGKENVETAIASRKGTQVVGNHKAIPDAFTPQTAIRFLGHVRLAEDHFRSVIGMVFVNRRPILSKVLEGGDYIPIVPERMLENEFLRTLTPAERKTHLRNARRINSAAFPLMRKFLGLRYWTLLYPEATRVLEPGMKKVHDGVATALRHPGTNLLPVAQIGTDQMWKPGSWRPQPLSKITVIFGEPISSEEAETRARKISQRYGVSEDRALCDLVMRRIARLMIENGHPQYAGFYAKPRRERLGVS
ncbi:MAG: lysophospholipid acyltransferase family protein [bacterium]|nr:lysophospholipid acyltransferase family protein [bacterium]